MRRAGGGLVGQCCSNHTVSIQSPYSHHTVTMLTEESEESFQCEICNEEREEENILRRELAVLKKEDKEANERNQQTIKEIEQIKKNYEVISKHMAAWVKTMRNTRDRDMRGAPYAGLPTAHFSKIVVSKISVCTEKTV